jgi:hypothetical protein
MRADIYWIDDLPWGGLAIVGRPCAGDWVADEISGWLAAGLSDIVSAITIPIRQVFCSIYTSTRVQRLCGVCLVY